MGKVLLFEVNAEGVWWTSLAQLREKDPG